MVVPVYYPEHLSNVLRLEAQAQRAGLEVLTFCNSAAAYAQARERGLAVAACHENVGYGRAANLATANEIFEWLILSNDDLEVRPGDFAGFIEVIRSLQPTEAWTVGLIDPGATNLSRLPGVIGVFTNVSLLGAVRARLGRLAPAGPLVGLSRMVEGGVHLREVTPGTTFPFVCVAISSACWTDLGGFSAHFALYFEDTDFLSRASKGAVHRFGVVPATLAHHGSASTKKDLRRTLPVYVWSAYQYLTRHTRASPRTARLMLCAALGVRLLLAPFSRSPIRDHLVGVARAIHALALNRAPQLPPWESNPPKGLAEITQPDRS
jgi:GT2 family glycosyltransferase